MDTKDWLLVLGVGATFVLGVANLIYNLRAGRRTAFVNTVTSERIKWIGKVRGNVAKLLSLCGQRMFNTPPDPVALDREIEELLFEIRLQLNPTDPEDKAVEELVQRVVIWPSPLSKDNYKTLRNEFTVATQTMLKREWDKVKDESVKGDLRKRKWWQWL